MAVPPTLHAPQWRDSLLITAATDSLRSGSHYNGEKGAVDLYEYLQSQFHQLILEEAARAAEDKRSHGQDRGEDRAGGYGLPLVQRTCLFVALGYLWRKSA